MKKISLITLIAVMVSFIGVSCKKYEEGTFSLASKKSRVAGDWTIEKHIRNGEDVTADIQPYEYKLSFTKDGDVTISTTFGSATGKWEFDDKKENIVITIDDDLMKWEILRLKKKELWVKDSSDPDQIDEIHFKQ